MFLNLSCIKVENVKEMDLSLEEYNQHTKSKPRRNKCFKQTHSQK